MQIIRIKKLSESAILPKYATKLSAGVDIHANLHENIVIFPGKSAIIPSGIAIALPEGYEAQVRPRSGLAAKNSITVLNSPGTVDCDYRGEIKVILINHGRDEFTVEHGMRIAQIVISKYEQVNFVEANLDADETDRGAKGFGSTGI
ncbi:MAG: dUTP diphosphatase [Rickettsiaceae bacterium]|nr:dUTP diphosphatase [Rickettsiaceae bacterium]